MMIKGFFSNLSERMRSENNLSDITWVMTQTSDRFLTEFLHFFFPKVRFGKVDLIREYAKGNSRVDFYFEYKNVSYIIECKIWDRKQHFEEYIYDFKIPPDRLGYITNYPLEKEGFIVKTWTELFQYLKKKIPAEEAQLWNAYLVYLQKVCNIFIPAKIMNTDGMYSLYEFYQCLDNIFSCDNDLFTSLTYENNDTRETYFGGNRTDGQSNNGLLGKYFQIDFKVERKRIKTARGWMGVYFWMEEPIICIGFSKEEEYGEPIYKRLKPIINNVPEGKTCSKPYEEEGVVWFNFTQNKRFNKLTTPNSQIKLLRSFFEEVMMTIANNL